MTPLHQSLAFTQAFQQAEAEHPARREAQCLKAQVPAILEPIRDGDAFAGRVLWPPVGFRFFSGPPHMGYYCNERAVRAEMEREDLPEADRERWQELLRFWKERTTVARIRQADKIPLPADMVDGILFDFGQFNDGQSIPQSPSSCVVSCSYRTSGINLDFDKLLQRGIPGLLQDVEARHKAALGDEQVAALCDGMKTALGVLVVACRYYAGQAGSLVEQATDPVRRTDLIAMRDALQAITQRAPDSLREAIQLFWLYARLANVDNFGRMDVYLADFYDSDCKAGRIDDSGALALVQGLWRLIAEEISEWSGRIFIGGCGRRNEAAADRFALLAMEASSTVRAVGPQLSLRLHQGMNPALFTKALDVIGEGCVFPMLYNDDVNVPAFQQVFGVDRRESEQYLASDCGEFALDHRTIGFPDGNLITTQALELALRNGVDPASGKPMGLRTGACADFAGFDDLWTAYVRQIEHALDVVLDRFEPMYRVLDQETFAVFMALLFDDCLAQGKGLFSGARYKGLVVEIYGLINVADSLTAIQQVVFEQKRMRLDDLVRMMDADFAGYEKERHWLRNAPKYGNDHDVADDMAVKVYQHVCEAVKAHRKRLKLDYCLADLITAGGHIDLGKITGALPDGRLAGQPLANANSPSTGNDRLGPTALLNSLVKLHPSAIGGQVQYLKLDRELFTHSRDKLEALLKTYFANGGAQAMITVVNRDELENAMKEPEKHGNLIVRIGGYCARFVSLSLDYQQEIIDRTLQH